MEEPKSILHELYVYSEWKPEPEYIQKPDGLLPENISALWRWMKFLGPKKSLIDSVTAHKERQQKWHIALGDEGKVIAVLTDNILEIRTKRSDYATIAARTTVNRDAYAQWRKVVWSPDCAFLALAYGNGVVSVFDLTASNLFNIPIDCSRPEGLECTDNTHAVADIIFMPLRVKDTKWSWEVLVVNYDGKVRGYLVSQMDGFTLHHTTTFSGGIACVAYCDLHSTLYVAGVPRSLKDQDSAHNAGITAWRILNDEPYYKLSVVSDQLEGHGNDSYQLYIPFVTAKNLAFIIQMVLSPDGSKLVCLHCNGDVSVWRLPLLKLLYRFPLSSQPAHDLSNPLVAEEKGIKKDAAAFYAADVNWWSNEEVILSRFSGLVSVSSVRDLVNRLARAEFFQGAPRVTRAHDAAFVALECETSVLPAKRSSSDETMEVVKAQEEVDDNVFDLVKELFKSVLYAITDMETFQPKPRSITCVSRVYRLLAVKSTTPTELFSRKIESGNYSEALALAETFNLDSDLVYQQQWRKNPVSTEAIQKYLSKVSKKIWAVHQCVDRLPESVAAAQELLKFGLHLANDNILEEINKDRPEDEQITDHEDIVPEHLNAYTSELLRCRHVMLFYVERLWLYECILHFEKSTYQKEEYDRLRSHSVLRSCVELAKEGRIVALSCLWPQLQTRAMELSVLDKLPESLDPMCYQHLLPASEPMLCIDADTSVPVPEMKVEPDWCRKQIFRSIWSSNWSEETTPDTETSSIMTEEENIAAWYERRARQIEARSGLVSYALYLVTHAAQRGGGGGGGGLAHIHYLLLTLHTLVYDINVEDITLARLENMSVLETCVALMSMSTAETFAADLQNYVIPFLKRHEVYTNQSDYCFNGLCEYLESISEDDLAPILLLFQTPTFSLDVRTDLDLAERCLMAYAGTDQLELACDLLNTILKESDGTIMESTLVKRVSELERLVAGCEKLSWRGVRVAPRHLRDTQHDPKHAHMLLTRLARDLPARSVKPTQADWEKLLRDILELQVMLFDCVSKEQCYEIYASALLTSGDAATIRLAAGVVGAGAGARAGAAAGAHAVAAPRAVALVTAAAKEYFNSSSSLVDPALKLAECCLQLIKDDNPEIQEELDLIAALQILHTFDLNILPIQVRLCEDKMTLIESCLQSSPSAFLKSHKLLKLAALLRVDGDDEIAREAGVLKQVCQYAVQAGDGGGAGAVAAARRLAALRAHGAAPLLAHVAARAHAHADRATRRHLYAAALATAAPADMEDILKARLGLELESLQQMGVTMKETESHLLTERWPSTDDEFADAITTPVIEKKDLVPAQHEKKIPLFNYLLDSFQKKFALSENKTSSDNVAERTIHLQEFYKSLYPEHAITDKFYRYDRFSIPDTMDGTASVGHSVLKWFYIQNSLDDGCNAEMECEIVQKCADELMYTDTALSIACLVRSTKYADMTRTFIDTHHTDVAVSSALYAALIECFSSALPDIVYRTKPRLMAEMAQKQVHGTDEQLQVIQQCFRRLAGMAESNALRALGFSVNGLLFNADADYRREVVLRVARSPVKEHLETALSLARKYSLDGAEVWLQHAAAALHQPHLSADTLPQDLRTADLSERIMATLFPQISGDDYEALTTLFTLIGAVDDKPQLAGLTAAEHLSLLKKAKAASPDLDYKLVVSRPAAGELTAHALRVMRPDNVAALAKFLRDLPPALQAPISVNVLYTKWLTKYFFSVPPTQASSKKWMQQYRQCSSYFNKLSKAELLQFVNDTCFTDAALERVPACTRVLMIMQAVEYCQQEQENEYKVNTTEESWAQTGQQLARWARFLENFHSPTVQAIVANCPVPGDAVWPEIEKSHGGLTRMLQPLMALVMQHELRGAALTSLLQCLHVDLEPSGLFQHFAGGWLRSTQEVSRLSARLTAYHAEGVRFAPELVERVLARAAELGLAPQTQIALLALSPRAVVGAADDIAKVAQFSLQLFRTEWPKDPYLQELNEEMLMTEVGRRAAFCKFLEASETLHQRKALVDVLACWPPIREGEARSLHCDFLLSILHNPEVCSEALAYIKILLRRPLLTDAEVRHIARTAPTESAVNVIWVMLLNQGPSVADDVVRHAREHEDTLKQTSIEEAFIRELLDRKLLVPLVPTVLYSNIVSYVVAQETCADRAGDVYDVLWACDQLIAGECFPEAGNLYLIGAGVPSMLRGFSETILFHTNLHLFGKETD